MLSISFSLSLSISLWLPLSLQPCNLTLSFEITISPQQQQQPHSQGVRGVSVGQAQQRRLANRRSNSNNNNNNIYIKLPPKRQQCKQLTCNKIQFFCCPWSKCMYLSYFKVFLGRDPLPQFEKVSQAINSQKFMSVLVFCIINCAFDTFQG